MNKTDTYRQKLATLQDWEPYLLQESGLPGPRGNLELAQVVADLGDRALFERFLAYTPDIAPVNDPHEFLAFCGVVGLGRLLAEGDDQLLERIRTYACDPRWRMREGVAMALQRLGRVDMPRLLAALESWMETWTKARAAAIGSKNGLQPPLLLNRFCCTIRRMPVHALSILDRITASMENSAEAKSEEFKVLQQGLGYCWSVVVVAAPEPGQPLMEKWLACPDPAIRRLMQENLKKNRLIRMDPAWVEKWRKK